MIDENHPVVSGFLWVSGSFFAIVFALPLFVAPLWWAKKFLWKLPEQRDLTVYFGRCVGALALALVYAVLRSAPDPAGHRWIFELLIAAGVPLTIVHIRGAIERSQPWTETLEIGLYGGMVVLAILCLNAL